MICSGISDTIAFSGYYSFGGAMNIGYDYSRGCSVPDRHVNNAMIGTIAQEREIGGAE